MNWPKVQISEFGKVVTGKTPSSKNPEHFGEIYPFITPTDIGEGRRVETERYLSTEGFNQFQRQILPKNSVCFVCIGATIGKICMTSDFSLTNQQINSIIVNSTIHNPFYVYYLLSTYAQKVKSIAGGAATPIVNKSAFESIKAPCPPLPTQRKIASILSAYDDLIENNLRRIKILEEMAQTLYREWFVKFRFPGHEKVRMVDSALGKIPEGWEVSTVKDIVERIPSGKKYDQKTVSPEGTVPVLDQGRSGTIGYHDDEAGVKASEDNPIIVFPNHTCYQRIILFPFSAIQNVLPFLPHPNRSRNIYWLHYATKDLVVFNDYKGHWPEFMSKELILPPADICERFGEFVETKIKLIYRLEKKDSVLRQTRDLLLPKLISCELDVSDLDIDTSTLEDQFPTEIDSITNSKPQAKPIPSTEAKEAPKKRNSASSERAPATSSEYQSPTPIDQWETNDVLSVFRSVARGRGFMDREDLIREAAREMGYKRVGTRIASALRGHVRAALRRRVLESNTGTLRIATPSISDYGTDELIDTLCSSIRKGQGLPREEAIREAAKYLGFQRITQKVQTALKNAIRTAIRRGIFEGDREEIRRVG